MATDFLPRRDADLVIWSNNFATQVAALTTQVGITAAQSTAFAALNTAWVNAYTVATNSMTRSPGNIILKDEAKAAMVANARVLAGIAQKHPETTDAQRADLGINVPKQRAPIGVPAVSPVIRVTGANGRTLTVSLKDPNGTNRGLPAGVAGIALFSHVGASAPVNIDDWKFEGNTGRTVVDVAFDASLPPGTTVWLTAFYFNPRKESGQASDPVSKTFGGAGVSTVEADLKLAA